MSSKKATKVDVTYKNGFMVGRMVAIDESEGFDVPIPGVDVRVRVEAITSYTYGAPHCIVVECGDAEAGFNVWGTMEAMDEVIARDRLGAPVVATPVLATPPVRGTDLKIVPWVDPDQPATA